MQVASCYWMPIYPQWTWPTNCPQSGRKRQQQWEGVRERASEPEATPICALQLPTPTAAAPTLVLHIYGSQCNLYGSNGHRQLANGKWWEDSIDSLYKISINAMWQVEENFEETSEEKIISSIFHKFLIQFSTLFFDLMLIVNDMHFWQSVLKLPMQKICQLAELCALLASYSYALLSLFSV